MFKEIKSCADINSLPFAHDSFDLLTCLEVIEHLPSKTYESGLSELCRIANKYLIVSVPYDENLRPSHIECPSCFAKFHPYNHLRSFNEQKIVKLLDKFSFTCVKIIYIGNSFTYLNPVKSLKNINKNPYPFNINCVVCGYPIEGSSQGRKEKWIKKILKNIWPKKSKPIWILGLYQKKES